jgi:hypothetical protein
VQDLNIGAVTGADNHSLRTGNTNAFTGALFLQHCLHGTVGSLVSVNKGTGATTRNGACELQIDAGCNNIKVLAITAENTNASDTAVQAIGSNILLGDPRKSNGTAFAPYTIGGTNVSVFRYGLT